MDLPVRFDFIPYPLWRRRGLDSLNHLLSGFTAAAADAQPPATPARMAHYMTRWGILPDGMNSVAARDRLASARPDVVAAPPASESATYDGPIRLPAQWEPIEAVVLVWPSLYPPLWQAHAEMVEAISPVARVDILVSDPLWAAAAELFLDRRGLAALDRTRFIHLATDDIWIRDYGPFTGFRPDGTRAALDAIYDPLPAYPSDRDDSMPRRYGALQGIPVGALDLHTEGGNFWSDGQGTLFVSEGVYDRNPHLSRSEVERRLRSAFLYDKLVVTESLWSEETGHVDLVMKLADATTVLMNTPSTPFNRARIEHTRTLLSRESSAAGEPYRLIELPVPSPYLNWGVYPVWRSYTNSLTVNGRVLVPIFRVGQDARALALYQSAMPEFEIVPIDCSQTANGGGAVHCLTREIYKG
ncbi:MAG: agmatine deiminase family protein [Anaerolineae bacterium]